MTDKMTRWLTVSAVFAGVTPAVRVPRLYTYGLPLSLRAVLGQGELLLITGGICLSAVGELLSRAHPSRPAPTATRARFRIAAAGVNLFWAIGAAVWYGSVSVLGLVGQAARWGATHGVPERVVAGSLVVFALGVVSGAAAISLSEE